MSKQSATNEDSTPAQQAITRASDLITQEVIELHTPALLAFARRMLRRREDAEDVVQETWVSAIRSAATFGGRSSLRTWLTGILRRRIFDSYQREVRRDPWPDDLSCEAPSRPEDADLRAAASHVRLALEGLRELERTAIVLCHVDELDRVEVATRMGISREYLRKVLNRAHSKLGRHLLGRGVNAEILC